MGMFGTGINAQVRHLLATQRVARNHAFNRLDNDAFGMIAADDFFSGNILDTAGMSRMAVINFVVHLFARQVNLFGIDDDNIVTAINVRRETGFMLAAQNLRDQACQTTQNQIFGINQIPLLFDFGRLNG